MSDTISLVGLRARGRHGVLPEERVLGQQFVVDLTLHLDTREAAATDDLVHTVDYGSLATDVVDVVEGQPLDLIETLAQRIADVCLTRARVNQVEVTVHKPQAPIQVQFSDVIVRISRVRAPRIVVLALGSNLGSRLLTLRGAVGGLGHRGLAIEAVSSVYETDPVGGPEQPTYLNAALAVRTSLSLSAVLAHAHSVEAAAGRAREVRWGPRTLDVDLVAAGAETSADPACEVPHPRAHKRAFVLLPWLDVQPDAVLPGHGPVDDLVATIGTHGVRRRDDLVLEVPA